MVNLLNLAKPWDCQRFPKSKTICYGGAGPTDPKAHIPKIASDKKLLHKVGQKPSGNVFDKLKSLSTPEGLEKATGVKLPDPVKAVSKVVEDVKKTDLTKTDLSKSGVGKTVSNVVEDTKKKVSNVIEDTKKVDLSKADLTIPTPVIPDPIKVVTKAVDFRLPVDHPLSQIIPEVKIPTPVIPDPIKVVTKAVEDTKKKVSNVIEDTKKVDLSKSGVGKKVSNVIEDTKKVDLSKSGVGKKVSNVIEDTKKVDVTKADLTIPTPAALPLPTIPTPTIPIPKIPIPEIPAPPSVTIKPLEKPQIIKDIGKTVTANTRDISAGIESIKKEGSAGVESIKKEGSAGIESIKEEGSAGIESIKEEGSAGVERFKKEGSEAIESVKKEGIKATNQISQEAGKLAKGDYSLKKSIQGTAGGIEETFKKSDAGKGVKHLADVTGYTGSDADKFFRKVERETSNVVDQTLEFVDSPVKVIQKARDRFVKSGTEQADKIKAVGTKIVETGENIGKIATDTVNTALGITADISTNLSKDFNKNFNKKTSSIQNRIKRQTGADRKWTSSLKGLEGGAELKGKQNRLRQNKRKLRITRTG